MNHDPESLRSYPYASSRAAMLATEGLVATSQPLAAQAGLGVLADGGSAVDAAIATAAALTVVEPCSNGLGSDAFALVWDGGQLHGLNGSGRWPAAASAEALRDAGHHAMPSEAGLRFRCPVPSTPGPCSMSGFGACPSSGSSPRPSATPRRGHPLSPVVARQWEAAFEFFPQQGLSRARRMVERSSPLAAERLAGEVWASPGHARGLRCLAERGLRDFYEGEVADAIASYAAETGGLLRAMIWPLIMPSGSTPSAMSTATTKSGRFPPNGQGIAALMALGMVGQHPDGLPRSDRRRGWHYQIEAMKLAFADSDAYTADQAVHRCR